MKKLVSSVEQLAGLCIGLLGMIVAIRWVFSSKTIAMLIPGSAQMGINTPVLFMAAGFCCYFALRPAPTIPENRGLTPVFGNRWRRLLDAVWGLCAGLLVVLPLLVLAEHIFDVSLGIDFVRVPTAPTASTPHPGRMAPNTSLGFLLAGCALLLARKWRPTRVRALALAACAGAVSLIGIAALLGYFLKLEGMYRIATSNVMLPATAVGMSVLGLGLCSLYSTLAALGRQGPDSAERITARALALLTVVTLSAGAAGFTVMRDSYEQSISENMLHSATSSAASLRTTLESRVSLSRAILALPDLAAALDGGAGARSRMVLEHAAAQAGSGIGALQFFDAAGRRLAGRGDFVAPGAGVRHPLMVDGQSATLIWHGGYVLRVEHQLRDGQRALGQVVSEQRLPMVDQLFGTIRAAGPSSDVLLCHRAGTQAQCGPTRFHSAPFQVPMAGADGAPVDPISAALLGRTGVAVIRDRRGIPVFAAYTPVSGLALGLVVKSDVDTVYAALKEKANMLVLALAVLVALGASVLLLQVRPLLLQLVREQSRTRVILENSNDAFIALGTDGRITDWNTQAERTFGWSAREALGRELSELIIPPAMRAAHQAGFARYRKTGTGPVINTRLEVTALRRDGSEIPVELSVAGFHNGQGYVANAFIRDITERRRLAAEIEARAIELEQERDRAQAANRAKSEFVANMSHELRTPMNSVLGMTYLLGHTDLKAEQKKYLEMIRASGQSLMAIMNDILDFSKVEAGRMELAESRFLLGDVMDAVATIMSVNAGERDLELAVGIEPDVPLVLVGDALRLQQVLVNLVGNAVKFTEQGEVSLLAELLAREGEQVRLQLRVRDTGIGMDADQQARLFSPFTQGDSSTTRRFGGTGLGLSISRQLVELMGGTIELDSEPGRGSEFRVALPLRVAPDQDDALRQGEALGALRLLIVDDNRTSREYLAKTSARWRWRADWAESGQQAIGMAARAEATGDGYDVVLLDWQMPGMGGLQTLRTLRKLAPPQRLPVILMVNAYGRGELMKSASAGERESVLSKPVTGSSLLEALHEILAQRVRPGAAKPPASARPAPAAAPAAAPTRLDGVRLLMAEDNEMNQIVACSILERLGAKVEVAANGELAVARLAATPGAWDLVLMDVQMPVMDGFAAARHIRTVLSQDVPIVAMTAGVTDAERASCLAAGMDDLIAKPVDVDQMLATIARHIPRLRPPAPAASGLPVLMLEPLVSIAKGSPGHLDAIAGLLQTMVDDGTTNFDAARASWAEGQPERAARLLHSVRGGVGSLGAKRFVQASQALEKEVKLCIAGMPYQPVEPLFELARAELDAALEAARAWLAQHRARGGQG
jgi:PAS domain S-box-containing protein